MKSEEFYSWSLECVVEKITKRIAKRIYEDGGEVYLNISLYSCDGADFDAILNEYRYYNCDKERGRYIHFFRKK